MALGCKNSPDLQKELDTVRSWTATAHFAVTERQGGATTAAYTRQLHDRAAAALDEERKTVGEAARTSDDSSKARPVLDSLSAAVVALEQASRR